jgi:uncharacterized sulfatase
MSTPNLLVFFTDQQRPDSIGCYGQPLPTTPNLDRMAAEGVRFNHAYSPNPLCGPCRAALQTGRYPTATGNHVNNIHLPEDADTLAKQLSAAGYSTGYLGKWHLASTGATGPDQFRTTAVPERRRGGYADYWLAADALEWTSHGYGGFVFDQNNQAVTFDNKTYRVDFLTDHLVDAIDKLNQPDKPFFMMASYLEPHQQNDRDSYEAPKGFAEKFRYSELPGDLLPNVGNAEKEYANYLGCVHSLDLALGRVLDKLDDLGIADNTLIAFISDHGCHFRNRNSEYKRSCHDASIHVPMILKGPGFEGGVVREEITSLLDIPATLLAAAGVELPADWQGRPLQQVEANDWRSVNFSQLSESQVGRCIRTERWTYSVSRSVDDWKSKGEKPPAACEFYVEDFLYDNENDPQQQQNLIADPAYAEIREKLKATLLDQIKTFEGLTPGIRHVRPVRFP